jgi:hypothetical protein
LLESPRGLGAYRAFAHIAFGVSPQGLPRELGAIATTDHVSGPAPRSFLIAGVLSVTTGKLLGAGEFTV